MELDPAASANPRCLLPGTCIVRRTGPTRVNGAFHQAAAHWILVNVIDPSPQRLGRLDVPIVTAARLRKQRNAPIKMA
jgi:hypothetical protein